MKTGESQPAQEPGAGLMVKPAAHTLAFHAVFLRWSCSFSASSLVTVASWWFGQDVAWERVLAGGIPGETSQSVLCSAQNPNSKLWLMFTISKPAGFPDLQAEESEMPPKRSFGS